MTTLDAGLARLAARAARETVLVALDFDGVLAPLVDDPGTSTVTPAAAAALDRLAGGPAHLALVSGRVLAELAGALLVNPHDIDGLKDAIERAARMDPREMRSRMRRLRRRVLKDDVRKWSDTFLRALTAPVPTESALTEP